MRYAMQLSTLFTPLLALFGGTRSRSYLDLDDQGVRLRFGIFDERVPLEAIASAEPTTVPLIAGVGWKVGPGTVGLLGSQQGTVRLTLREPRPMRFFGFPVRTRNVVVSLEEPDAFLADLRGRLPSARA